MTTVAWPNTRRNNASKSWVTRTGGPMGTRRGEPLPPWATMRPPAAAAVVVSIRNLPEVLTKSTKETVGAVVLRPFKKKRQQV
ncbi:hypothetical protein Hdeb2414_s0569g00918041 [Helianthus debilis subsp. tardiflorus]